MRKAWCDKCNAFIDGEPNIDNGEDYCPCCWEKRLKVIERARQVARAKVLIGATIVSVNFDNCTIGLTTHCGDSITLTADQLKYDIYYKRQL